MTAFCLRYDLRAPGFGPSRPEDLYRAALDQAEWADELGFSAVTVSEHHGSDDGYLPSPHVFAAALAGRTTSLRIRLAAAIATLHHPIRLAEDLAVLDLASGGRLELVLGCGYRRAEYEMLGQVFEGRGERLEMVVGVLRQAWTGEPFDFQGSTVRVTPRPTQDPGPPILLGGASPGSARRAARVADGYSPVAPELWELYRSACEEIGRDPGPPPSRSNGPVFVHVADDPEEAWRRIAPHALHETNSYAHWLSEDPTGEQVYAVSDDATALLASGMYRVMTPEQCIEFGRDLDELVLHPLMGGLAPELAWSSLELFAETALPSLREPDAPHPRQEQS